MRRAIWLCLLIGAVCAAQTNTGGGQSGSGGGGGSNCPVGTTGNVQYYASSGNCGGASDINVSSNTMTAGTGGTITTSGTGVNNANHVNGAAVATSSAYVGTNSSGQIVAATNPTTSFACSTISGGVPASGICTISLTATQIKSLLTPVALIAAQGANTFIDVTKITAEFVCNSCTPYTIGSGGGIELFWGTTDSSANFPATGFLDQSTGALNEIGTLLPIVGFPVTTSELSNQALNIQNNGSSNYTLGTGTVNFTIQYTITAL